MSKKDLKQFLPLLTVVVVLVIHCVIPNKTDLGYSYYPRVLIGGAVIYIVLMLLGFKVKRIRDLLTHRAIFISVLLIIIEAIDCMTLKSEFLPLPFFPSPDKMIYEFVEGWQMMGISALYSMRLLLTGFVVGCILGFITGLLLGWYEKAAYWIDPLMKFVGPLPATALLPLAMIAFPTSFMSSTFIIVFGVWFPMTIMTAAGIQSCRKSWLEGASVMGASNRQLVWHVAVPAAMPSIHTGMFMGLSNSFVTLITAEMLGVKAGLGWYIRWATNWANYAKIYDVILIMAVLFSGMIKLQFYIRDRQLKWQEGIVK